MMDDAAASLERLQNQIKSIRAKIEAIKSAHRWLPDILDEIYEAEDITANMRIFAENWELVAEKVNGVQIEPEGEEDA
jgi:prefoldin subunit 5